MMTTRLLVVNSRGMPCRSRPRASECQATAFSSSVWQRHFKQPHAAAVGVEGIDVVDDDELVAVPVELHVHAERGGVALDPARLAVEDGPDGAALGQAAGADEDQQVEVPLRRRRGGTPPAARRSSGAGPCAGCPGGVSAWQAWRALRRSPGTGAGPFRPLQGDLIRFRLLDLPHQKCLLASRSFLLLVIRPRFSRSSLDFRPTFRLSQRA